MSKSLKRVTQALLDHGVPLDIVELEQARTAQMAADGLGIEVDQIVKSIIFWGETSQQVVLFLTAGGNRVDPARAAEAAQEPLAKADAALVRKQTGFAIGGVAPVGHLAPPRVFWDQKLDDFERIWGAAGTPRHVFGISPARLREISGAQVFDFTC